MRYDGATPSAEAVFGQKADKQIKKYNQENQTYHLMSALLSPNTSSAVMK